MDTAAPQTPAPGPGFRVSRALASALMFLPARLPLGLLRTAGRLCGTLAYLALPRRRRIARVNVERAKEAGFLPPDLDAGRTARLSFGSVAVTFLEGVVLLKRGLGPFEGRWRVAGRENALAALEGAEGRGALFLTAHMGPWELSPHVMRAEFGIRMAVVGRGQGGGVLESLMVESRTVTGNTFIFKDRGAREMLKVLKGGGCVGTLVDQAAVVEREGAELSFMGRPARTNLGPYKLAARTGAPVVPLFARREGPLSVIEIFPPIRPPAPGADPGGGWPAEAAQRVNDLLGEQIRLHPPEWMWGHRRWKTPEGIRDDPGFF
ncbi:MAG: lysophospholipid acyltransferase family protein [Deltaproteobacteria bacterium]|nr:lysophospholipid acyltransferase family protein [Deltaproteobacteria bacterium]